VADPLVRQGQGTAQGQQTTPSPFKCQSAPVE